MTESFTPLPVFIITDFGQSDTYVGQMKAVMVRIAGPALPMVDLTHSVPRGDVAQGLFHLSRCLRWLPPRSVVLAVVDPGVGSSRRPVAARVGESWLVGPDNGLLVPEMVEEVRLLSVPEDSSATFHGRDVFAPAAARLAVDPRTAASLPQMAAEELIRLEGAAPASAGSGTRVTVAHVDRFGNVLLWLRPDELSGERRLSALLPDGRRMPLVRASHYAGHRGLLLVDGSQGLMELAVNGGSASAATGLHAGDGLILEEGDP